MTINRKMKIILSIIVLFILSCCVYTVCKHGNQYPFKDKQMINVVNLAKKVDKDKYIVYQEVERVKESKELIAVVFNTDSEYNVGFIDEFGNVIKEPFLKDPYYDFTNTSDGQVGINSYYNGYFYDSNSKKIYDEKFAKVDIANENSELFESNYKKERTYEKVSHENYKKIEKTLKKLVLDGYKTNEYNVGYNGTTYFVPFGNSSGATYYILLDKNYNLLTHIYYSQGNENQCSSIEKDSKVGNAFVRDLGLVYYNIYGDIIWITYCK